MSVDVNQLRRRSPGPRVLVAVDQSTLSDLALDHAHGATRELLVRGVDAGKLVCPMSLGANDETLDAPGVWETISDLHEELSMAIEFLDPKQIRQREAFAAAAAFCEQPPLYTVAEEAFDRDPTPLGMSSSPGFRVIARFGPMDFRSAEVAREKSKEATLQPAYDAARVSGRSFEEQAQGEYEQMVEWLLGPLADPGYDAEAARKLAAATRGLMAGGDRGALSKYQAVAERKEFAEALVENYPIWPAMDPNSRAHRSWRRCRRCTIRPCFEPGWLLLETNGPNRATATTSTTSPPGSPAVTS